MPGSSSHNRDRKDDHHHDNSHDHSAHHGFSNIKNHILHPIHGGHHSDHGHHDDHHDDHHSSSRSNNKEVHTSSSHTADPDFKHHIGVGAFFSNLKDHILHPIHGSKGSKAQQNERNIQAGVNDLNDQFAKVDANNPSRNNNNSGRRDDDQNLEPIRIIFIRHGQSRANAGHWQCTNYCNPCFYCNCFETGEVDALLTEDGMKQCRIVGRQRLERAIRSVFDIPKYYLKDGSVVDNLSDKFMVLSSPLTRSVMTSIIVMGGDIDFNSGKAKNVGHSGGRSHTVKDRHSSMASAEIEDRSDMERISGSEENVVSSEESDSIHKMIRDTPKDDTLNQTQSKTDSKYVGSPYSSGDSSSSSSGESSTESSSESSAGAAHYHRHHRPVQNKNTEVANGAKTDTPSPNRHLPDDPPPTTDVLFESHHDSLPSIDVEKHFVDVLYYGDNVKLRKNSLGMSSNSNAISSSSSEVESRNKSKSSFASSRKSNGVFTKKVSSKFDKKANPIASASTNSKMSLTNSVVYSSSSSVPTVDEFIDLSIDLGGNAELTARSAAPPLVPRLRLDTLKKKNRENQKINQIHNSSTMYYTENNNSSDSYRDSDSIFRGEEYNRLLYLSDDEDENDLPCILSEPLDAAVMVTESLTNYANYLSVAVSPWIAGFDKHNHNKSSPMLFYVNEKQHRHHADKRHDTKPNDPHKQNYHYDDHNNTSRSNPNDKQHRIQTLSLLREKCKKNSDCGRPLKQLDRDYGEIIDFSKTLDGDRGSTSAGSSESRMSDHTNFNATDTHSSSLYEFHSDQWWIPREKRTIEANQKKWSPCCCCWRETGSNVEGRCRDLKNYLLEQQKMNYHSSHPRAKDLNFVCFSHGIFIRMFVGTNAPFATLENCGVVSCEINSKGMVSNVRTWND